mgnify:CR=1 FL=1
MKVIHSHAVGLISFLLFASAAVFGNTFVAPEGPAREVNEIRSLKAVLKDAKAIDAAIDRVCDHFDLVVQGDLQAAMNVMNVRG